MSTLPDANSPDLDWLITSFADGWIDLGECKWSGRPSLANAARELQRRVASYPSAGRTVRSHLFFRRAPRAPRARFPEMIVHDLAQLYGT